MSDKQQNYSALQTSHKGVQWIQEKAPTAMNQEAVELGTVQTPMLSLPALDCITMSAP